MCFNFSCRWCCTMAVAFTYYMKLCEIFKCAYVKFMVYGHKQTNEQTEMYICLCNAVLLVWYNESCSSSSMLEWAKTVQFLTYMVVSNWIINPCQLQTCSKLARGGCVCIPILYLYIVSSSNICYEIWWHHLFQTVFVETTYFSRCVYFRVHTVVKTAVIVIMWQCYESRV